MAVCLSIITSGLLTGQRAVSSTGTISSSINLDVYYDAGCTQNCSTINWGSLSPGITVNQTIYVMNSGNTPVTLDLSTSNWSPASASSYFILTWDQEGNSLPVGSVVPATLTLTVASDTGSLTDFSFNIMISGSR